MYLLTFLGQQKQLEAYEGVSQLSDFIKNILICVVKDEQKSYGVGTA